MKATFKLNDGRVRIGVPVLRRNTYTVLVQSYRKASRYAKPYPSAIKRHIVKHNVILTERGDEIV